ncbi:Zn-ribbon domain-containing OB-fold protein [Streptomyces sp. A3M-1-3]|uniref:Zn-ribbon domain-containing OB-fold protein n=1 Tax=Streptomyces sp. A3M-1-3 TaxID=2962044 RepID=UPI0020B6A694|nr:Zn-ribbon domain-containing OB-fold protein [Streptomyces sp. A3M-1-3]MCP3821927.1 Zn-ribbon domain-containing OB-fold protein [Streptomyces sp. A3M-1-3]
MSTPASTPPGPADARFDLPEPDAFTRPYWEAAAQGRLLLRRCSACGRAHHYPREFCPHCWSDDVTWEPTSGRATLYTWSVVHRNDLPPFGSRVPYVAAVVDLAEGPRMMTEVVDCAAADLRIGMALEVAFRNETKEVAIAVFRPDHGQSSSRTQSSPSRR